jgi:hypothetical protein
VSKHVLVTAAIVATFIAVAVIGGSWLRKDDADAERCRFGRPCPSVVPSSSPSRSAARDPIITAAGDIADRHPSAATRATARLIEAIKPTVALALGDNQYPAASLQDFRTGYGRTWGAFLERTRPTLGNHEVEADPTASGYFDYFGRRAPDNDYSFDIGAWHLISLDSNCPRVPGCSPDRQVRWLKKDLVAHPATCTLAYWHHPRWSSGTEDGNDPHVAPLVKVLYNAGADVILNGHEHNYERFAPQMPDGRRDPGRGLTEFVVGTGGKGLSGLGPADPNSVAASDTTFGVLQMTLHPDSYDFVFKSVLAGRFRDAGSARCH